jgi:hypothetical protein
MLSSRASISNIFRAHSYALDGPAVPQEMLKSAGEFEDDIIGQVGIYLGGKQRKLDQEAKLCSPIDQIVRDIRKSENAVVDRRLQKLFDDTEDLDSLELPELRAGSWPVEVLLVEAVFQTIVTAARDGFQVKSGLNTPVVSRSWIANGFVRFEELRYTLFFLYNTSLIVFGFLCSSTSRTTTSSNRVGWWIKILRSGLHRQRRSLCLR